MRAEQASLFLFEDHFALCFILFVKSDEFLDLADHLRSCHKHLFLLVHDLPNQPPSHTPNSNAKQ